MSETNKSLRVRTNVGVDSYVSVDLNQDYEAIDILSVSIRGVDSYRLHNSNYGVIVGRVLANNGFGIPNAKISVFIAHENGESSEISDIYPFASTSSKNNDGVRYNLLPDNKVDNCHQVVGTFPNKRYVLDNDAVLEVFDKYYKYTTRTNNSGDYMICGVPAGQQTIHMDLDLSDCGVLSQRPRDFVYKGYTIEQFENPNMFKSGTEYGTLSQIISQDQTVNVIPFWGNESLGETIGITRADINVAFKFEPTCVFIGCVAGDNSSQGFSKKCIPTNHMGDMDELTTGEGKIEMIRKTYAGDVEEFQIKGTELIDANGVWCYQIPMNLDYMVTDEYGNMVPTDNPERGIPTRTRVRFRISMQDMEYNVDNFFRPKVLVPHNPQNLTGINHEGYDYEFGSKTKDESFRDLFWNNVYSVKSYIPRIQKKRIGGWKGENFSGIKHCQAYGANNPIPYNNMRIEMPFMFKVMCILIKVFIRLTSLFNFFMSQIGNILADIGAFHIGKSYYPLAKIYDKALDLKLQTIDEGLCPDLENWYFSPVLKGVMYSPKSVPPGRKKYNLLKQTLDTITQDDDPMSIDDQNQDTEDTATCLTINTDYLIACVEMNLAQEYRVINFDFYNDWVNGLIYFPRFMRYVRKKVKFLGITFAKAKVKGCMDDTSVFSKTRRYTQLCSLGYTKNTIDGHLTYSRVNENVNNPLAIIRSNNFHKKKGLSQTNVFGKNGGICHEKTTMADQKVYYMKPCEWALKSTPKNRKVNLFATDLILLGSLNDCDYNGIPQAFKHLSSSSYKMPTNLVLTNMDSSGPLYAYDNNTICSKNNQTDSSLTEDDAKRPVNIVDANSPNPLTAEIDYYSGASSNYEQEFDSDSYSDTIALTEAAGIAWNYSGPGQGNPNKKKIYYPGGHFLGLSCVNSQTNIKSCINLERICEAGVSMSQRREDVRSVQVVESAETVLNYVYSVPTGFISKDEIIDDDFRVMFATMNKKRLIATKLNPETGYRTYDFVYVNPTSFNGEFSKFTNGTPYNGNVAVTEESNYLARYGNKPANKRNDYDSSETTHTQKKTIEETSSEYYMFRLGLDYDDLTSKSNKHIRQFAKDKKGAMYLPQYENSFYFYFGMKNGATALDEFTKQFFSECENVTLLSTEPTLSIVGEGFNPQSGTERYSFCVENIETPYYYLLKTKDGVIFDAGITEDTCVTESALTYGDYNYYIADSEGVSISQDFSVGEGFITGEITTADFNVYLENGYLARTPDNKNYYFGGFLTCTDVYISGYTGTGLSLVICRGDADPRDLTKVEVTSGITSSGETMEIYLCSANTDYDLYIKYPGPVATSVYVSLGSIVLKDSGNIMLTMGEVIKTPYYKLAYSAMTREDWWKQYNTDDNTLVQWNIRKSILNDTHNKGSDTFSSQVRSSDGQKAIFGTPQSSENILSSSTPHYYISEHVDGIPDGYSLDDDVSYWSTYGVDYYNTVKQYNTMAFNGTSVCGNYIGTFTTDSSDPNVKILDGTWGGVSKGLILKPLPYGELIFGVYDNGRIYCSGDTEQIESAESGIVYPTIYYPVIEKPFIVNANYFRIIGREIVTKDDGNGDLSMNIQHNTLAIKCESAISGGTTFKQYFDGTTVLPIITDLNDGDLNSLSMCLWYLFCISNGYDFEKPISASTKDLDGITQTSSALRVLKLSGWTSLYNGNAIVDENVNVDDLSYSVVDGYPRLVNKRTHDIETSNITVLGDQLEIQNIEEFSAATLYSNSASIRSLDINGNFFDKVYYNKGLGSTYNVFFEGNSDSDINYYAIPTENTFCTAGDYVYLNPEDYNWLGNLRSLYAIGYYTSAAMYDKLGDNTIVKIYKNWAHLEATVSYTDYDSSTGSYVYGEHNLGRIHGDDNVKINHLQEYLDSITNKCQGRIRFKKQYWIKSGGTNTLTSVISTACTPARQIKKVGGNSWSTDAVIGDGTVIVGVKNFEEDKSATGKLCYMYIYPMEADDKAQGQTIMVFYNGQQTSEVSVDGESQTITLTVSWLSGTTYESESDSTSWLRINNGGTGSGQMSTSSSTQTMTLSIDRNDSDTRTGRINLYDIDSSREIPMAYVDIVQQQAQPSGTRTVDFNINSVSREVRPEDPSIEPILSVGYFRTDYEADWFELGRLPSITVSSPEPADPDQQWKIKLWYISKWYNEQTGDYDSAIVSDTVELTEASFAGFNRVRASGTTGKKFEVYIKYELTNLSKITIQSEQLTSEVVYHIK